jgi:hypothetical protein
MYGPGSSKARANLAESDVMRKSNLVRRGAPLGRAVALLVLGLSSGIVGCATTGGGAGPAGTSSKDPYLLLRLGERRLYLKQGDTVTPPEGFMVAVGKPRYPTPTGKFQINEMVTNPDFLMFDFQNPASSDRGRIPPGPNNPLGMRWIAFAHEHGWAIGFHGTTKTQFLGQAVSHGCVRMRNDDIVKVFDQVKLGTPVIVEP